MKAKRILAVILAAISLAGYGCSDRIELYREAVDSKFVPGHMAGTVMYVKSGNVLVPIDTRHHVDDAWKIQYRITYDDGTVKLKWVTVSEEVYDDFNERGGVSG